MTEDQSATDYMEQGRSFLKRSLPTDAHAAFCLAENLSPQLPEINALLSMTSLLLNAPHKAMDHAEKALAIEPGNLDATLVMANAARRIGDKEAAEKATKALTDVEGTSLYYKLLILQDALDLGDYEVALSEIATICEDHPENIHARELFAIGLDSLSKDRDRFDALIDGLGLQFQQEPGAPTPLRNRPAIATIDIIIPIYNALGDLITCLESIRRWWSPAIHRIILVDDASNQDTASWLDSQAQKYPEILLIRQSSNRGFTPSIIEGLAQSNAEFSVLLNSDTIVTAGWLDRLWAALNRRPTTALAGPFSNNSYFQSISPDVIDPNFAQHAANFTQPDVDQVSALVLANSRFLTPRVPLLSGFCLMLRRSAYDLVGGFDVQRFPEGYWEVQDLCLRLLDIGFDMVIADDAYVHHIGSSSIITERRHRLLADGLQQIYSQHSALRLLCAEWLCRRVPETLHHQQAWYQQFSNATPQLNPRRDIESAGLRQTKQGTRQAFDILKSLDFDPTDEEVCLFVLHAPLGQASEYTLHYLQKLRESGLKLIVCAVADTTALPVQARLFLTSDALILRQNGGYDFAAWADMLEIFPNLWHSKRLFFANDSVIGPFQSLEPIISKIRNQNSGFFALSECTNTGYHAQSFFFGWNATNLLCEGLQKFWRDVICEAEKIEVILNYEYGISKLSPNLPDRTQQIVFGMKTIFCVDPRQMSCINPTHNSWKYLLSVGFPFVKTDLLRDGAGAIDTSDWQDVCQSHGADIGAVHRHIETSRINRLKFRF